MIETCNYYACPFDGEISERQKTILDKCQEEELVFHLKCYLDYINERIDAHEAKEAKRRK